jgi:hypothetical protein
LIVAPLIKNPTTQDCFTSPEDANHGFTRRT